jgi:hypothetical protein
VSFKLALASTCASAVLALALAFLIHFVWPVDKVFANSTYYLMWATFLLLFAAALGERQGGESPRRLDSSHWRPWAGVFLLGLVLTALTFIAVGTEFRVLSDESNLISTSRSIFLHRTVENLLQAEPYYGYFTTLESGLPTRPALFPFLVAIFHSLFGFNAYHGFVLNFAGAVAMVALMVRFGRQLVDWSYGVIAAVLLAAFPLYALVITSSGYDALNLFCVMAVFCLLHDFLKEPSARKLEVLCLTTVLAGQCRYESVLLIVPVAIAAFLRREKLQAEAYSWRIVAVPLLMLPIVWQRQAMGLVTLQQDGRTDVFNVRHVWPNLVGAYNLLFNPARTNFPRSNIVIGLALLGAGWFAARLLRRRATRLTYEMTALTALGMLLLMAVHLTFYMGDISAAYQMRMGLIYLGLIALAAAYPVRALLVERWRRPLTYALLAVLFLHELPVAVHNEVGKSLLLYREFRDANSYFKKLDRPFVVISDWPVLYTAMGYGSMSYDYLRGNANKVRRSVRMHLYDVYAVEGVPEDKPPKQAVPAVFASEAVAEFQNDANMVVRIAKLLPAPDEVKIKGRKALAE